MTHGESGYVTWLERTADELASSADELEALARGSWLAGGVGSAYFSCLEQAEEQRTRARAYRAEAQELRRWTA